MKSKKAKKTAKPRSRHLRLHVSKARVQPAVEGAQEKPFETVTTATNDATDAAQNGFARVLQGIQEYNGKVFEFTQSNTHSYVELVHRMAGTKSPLDFLKLFHDHSRHQMTTLREQAQELASLIQKIAGSIGRPFKTEFEQAMLVPRYRN